MADIKCGRSVKSNVAHLVLHPEHNEHKSLVKSVGHVKDRKLFNGYESIGLLKGDNLKTMTVTISSSVVYRVY